MQRPYVKSHVPFSVTAKKNLGQNFLTDIPVIENIATAIDTLFAKKHKYVHEIGPGTGALSTFLLQHGIHVTAIEKDPRCVAGLQKSLAQEYPATFTVQTADILQWTPTQDPLLKQDIQQERICVGNIPYYITSPILMWFCKFSRYYSHGVFMVQEEVADRLIANAGSKDYGRLTVKLQLFFNIEKLFSIPARCFSPKPKVNSAIISLTPKDFTFSSETEERAFEEFTALLFSARRKMLRRALANKLDEYAKKHSIQNFWDFINKFNIDATTRPDAIPPETILAMHNFFCNS